MNYEIREMKPEDGEVGLKIFQEGIDSENATFDKDAPSWEVWEPNILTFVAGFWRMKIMKSSVGRQFNQLVIEFATAVLQKLVFI